MQRANVHCAGKLVFSVVLLIWQRGNFISAPNRPIHLSLNLEHLQVTRSPMVATIVKL